MNSFTDTLTNLDRSAFAGTGMGNDGGATAIAFQPVAQLRANQANTMNDILTLPNAFKADEQTFEAAKQVYAGMPLSVRNFAVQRGKRFFDTIHCPSNATTNLATASRSLFTRETEVAGVSNFTRSIIQNNQIFILRGVEVSMPTFGMPTAITTVPLDHAGSAFRDIHAARQKAFAHALETCILSIKDGATDLESGLLKDYPERGHGAHAVGTISLDTDGAIPEQTAGFYHVYNGAPGLYRELGVPLFIAASRLPKINLSGDVVVANVVGASFGIRVSLIGDFVVPFKLLGS